MDSHRNVAGAIGGARSTAVAAPGYYSIGQAAALLGVSRVTIWRWVRAGRLPVVRLGHRTTRIKREDLERLLQEHRQLATDGAGAPAAPAIERSAASADGAFADGHLDASAPRADWHGIGGADHLVQFYETDAFLVDAVSDFIGAALRAGDAGIVLATPAHRAAIEERLIDHGLDIAAAHTTGRYVALDAAEFLARCTRDGEPDWERFTTVIGGLIARAAQGGRRVRVFGELVALLVAEGNPAAALRLEAMWNALQQTSAFSLLCGYPMDGFDGPALATVVGDICAQHGRVIPTESYTALDGTDDRLRAIAVLQQRARSLEAEAAERRRAEALVTGQAQVLELIATGAALSDVLASLIRCIEEQADGLLCSVLVRDPEREQFALGVAPTLPESFIGVLAHAPIAPPYVGPCGRTAHLGEAVLAADVATDQRWSDQWRRLALDHGLRTCYSSPIIASDNTVLGSFGMYYRVPRDPKPANEQLIELATHLAGIAIERQRIEEAVQASERRFRSIFDESNDAIFVVSPERDVIVDVNARACDLLGYARAELLALPLSAVHPNEMPALTAFAQSVAEHGHGWTDALTCRTKSGRTVPAELSASRIELAGRTYMLALVRDITERKAAEDELRERTRQAELGAAVGAALTTGGTLQAQLQRCAEAIVRQLDAAFARIWTLNEAEQVLELQASAGMYTHLDGPHGRVPVGAYKIGTIATERQPHLTNDVPADPRISDPDWARREGMVAFAGYPLLVGGRLVGVLALFARRPLPASTLGALGAIAHTIAVGIDRAAAEAERARLLQRARDSRTEEETLRRVGQALSAELDQQQLVAAVTEAATQLSGAEHGAFFYNAMHEQGESYQLYTRSGAPKEQFTNLPMPRSTELFAPTFRGEAVIRLDDVTTDPRFGKNPPYYGLPEGHLPLRSYLAVPVVSRSGEVFGGLFFGHPEPGVFTERAERLVVGIATQAAIALDNARLYQQAQEAVRVRDDFLAAASHDLKNPLTTIKGTAQMLQRGLNRSGTVAPERLRGGLAGIGEAATQMAAQLEELLDIARLQSGRPLALERAPTDLVALARQAATSHQQATDRHRLRVETTTEAVVGDWDAARLARVLGNLLSNAIKYSPDGGEVVVGVDRVGDRAVVTVRDHGIGIPAADLPHIFERFHRAANAVGQMQGSGIGLSAARQIVEQHGGAVDVESEEGRGTTVTVRLPLAGSEREPGGRAPDPD